MHYILIAFENCYYTSLCSRISYFVNMLAYGEKLQTCYVTVFIIMICNTVLGIADLLSVCLFINVGYNNLLIRL